MMASSTAFDQTMAIQDRRDHALRGPPRARVMAGQPGPDLLRTPARMLRAQSKDRRFLGLTNRIGVRMRSPAAVLQSLDAFGFEPLDPFVPGLAAHAVKPAQGR